ncbi:MAG: hypothetical protein NUV75_00655 [Gallionella sp.]|nr:hypothetical protein [Gallionella sp.]
MKKIYERIALSIMSVGLIGAIALAIIYWMGLPIFDQFDLAWTFVYGLGAAAVAALSLAIKGIWGWSDD